MDAPVIPVTLSIGGRDQNRSRTLGSRGVGAPGNGGATLLAPSPSLLPINRERPSLLNLRIVSRSLSSHPDVLAAAGNNLLTLRRRITAAPPRTTIVELIPDHMDALLHFDAWIAAQPQTPRVLVAGAGLKYWSEHIRTTGPHLSLCTPGNPVRTLAGLSNEDAHAFLRPTNDEMRRQPLWEKRRIAVAFGCPGGCRLCPRREDEGTATRLRSVDDAFEEIETKLRLFGVRDVEVIGAAWASDPAWAAQFLEERIRRQLEVRLHLVVTVEQLTTPLVKLLAPAGCTRLTIRAGYAVPDVGRGLGLALRSFAARQRVTIVCPARPPDEPACDAGARVKALMAATHAEFVHVLLHSLADLTPACSELGRIADVAPMEMHAGRTQRASAAVRAWAKDFRRALE